MARRYIADAIQAGCSNTQKTWVSDILSIVLDRGKPFTARSRVCRVDLRSDQRGYGKMTRFFLIFGLFAFFTVDPTVTASREVVKIDLHFICPVDGDLITGFGSAPLDRSHGIEYMVQSKQAVIASERGTVRYVGGPISNFDKIVLISHPFSVYTVYGDIDDIVVETGQTVRRGDILGYTAKRPKNNQHGVHFQMRFGSPHDTSGIDPHTISKERSNMRYHCITNNLS